MDINENSRRRRFLKQFLSGTLTAAALPAFSFSSTEKEDALSLNDLRGLSPEEETYWKLIKKQFSVPQNLMMMNAANLCPSPYFINDLVSGTLKELEQDVSFQFRARFSARRAKSIEALAAFTGVSKEEIGILRNTSEANNVIVNGLDLKPGDEVITWDQNHASNGLSWEQKAKRMGFTIKKVAVPPEPKSAEELLAPFLKAITAKTKVIAFSHVSNLTGIALPAKAICDAANQKNILTLIDGAQTLGMMDLDLKAMGCTFYTASTHKWLMGPLENGMLYVKKDHLVKVWPHVISAGWKETGTTVDEKLCVLGQRNETTPFAIPEIIAFHEMIGRKKIEERVGNLITYLRQQIQAKIPQATFVTPVIPGLSGGIIVVNLPGKPAADIQQKLYESHGVACAATSGVRLSPHIYNTMEDMDWLVAALSSLSQ